MRLYLLFTLIVLLAGQSVSAEEWPQYEGVYIQEKHGERIRLKRTNFYTGYLTGIRLTTVTLIGLEKYSELPIVSDRIRSVIINSRDEKFEAITFLGVAGDYLAAQNFHRREPPRRFGGNTAADRWKDGWFKTTWGYWRDAAFKTRFIYGFVTEHIFDSRLKGDSFPSKGGSRDVAIEAYVVETNQGYYGFRTRKSTDNALSRIDISDSRIVARLKADPREEEESHVDQPYVPNPYTGSTWGLPTRCYDPDRKIVFSIGTMTVCAGKSYKISEGDFQVLKRALKQN
ncbi:MAG: hypothetical protein P1U75_05850 [Antarcticimicrobium sp.]|uniref:hypothetical protein n=1 Tax=Antarcticimicrobium sp. TaxID=2824147 RepID=UPI002610B89D|nr:hypothetical protein [Antarcticimicrobium sp.]MDF1716180.1 hypothetical protein [Antarcticimicrobium sp.]